MNCLYGYKVGEILIEVIIIQLRSKLRPSYIRGSLAGLEDAFTGINLMEVKATVTFRLEFRTILVYDPRRYP